jgi:hypothetical protein
VALHPAELIREIVSTDPLNPFQEETMNQSYRIRFRCPRGDYYKWAVVENLAMTLQQVYGAHWKFDCPAHGAQSARPFQAEIKKVIEHPAESRMDRMQPRLHSTRHAAINWQIQPS